MTDVNTILEIVRAGNPKRACILSPERGQILYEDLEVQRTYLHGALAHQGFSPRSRIALVLPNGPEVAVLFLAASTMAVCAPLNPQYTKSEFEFAFADLLIDAVITCFPEDSPVQQAAKVRGVPVLKLKSIGAGEFSVPCEIEGFAGRNLKSSELPRPGPDDIALLLHTSGTTGKPKIVPLSHRNLATSASNVRNTLSLSPQDRCLNVMPLFHIHGLVAALLASLRGGGSIVCTSGFDSLCFMSWLRDLAPTWYTAVPTIHQAVLGIEGRIDHRLRFIRSSSQALLPQVFEALEQRFGVPVIEAYGMTEAAHQIASNALPPGARRAGSVGMPQGVEVAIMDPQGGLVGSGHRGEVVLRGGSVFGGYERLEGTAGGFAGGWFRTGDEGYIATDGSLTLTDRLKEIINRGGEKISPREVDEVIVGHQDVVQAVTFAMPHRSLGEEIGVAVVLKDGSRLTESQLIRFARRTLTHAKVPKRVVIVDKMPTGATGKLQRISLAQKLKVESFVEKAEPRTESERLLHEVWQTIFPDEHLGVDDDFFSLGGDSLQLQLVIARIRARGYAVQPSLVLENTTIGSLAPFLKKVKKDEEAPVAAQEEYPLLPFQHQLLFGHLRRRATTMVGIALQARAALDVELLRQVPAYLQAQHEALNLRFRIKPNGSWVQTVHTAKPPDLMSFDFETVPEAERLSALEYAVRTMQSSIDVFGGSAAQFAYVNFGNLSGVLVVFDHTAGDLYSSSLLAEDFAMAYECLAQGSPVKLPARTTSSMQWAKMQSEAAQRGEFETETAYWQSVLAKVPSLPGSISSASPSKSDGSESIFLRLDAATTHRLNHECPAAYGARLHEVIMTGVARAIASWLKQDAAAFQWILLGRGPAPEEVDLSRTVGNLILRCPVVLDRVTQSNPGNAVKSVQEQLAMVPNAGANFMWLQQQKRWRSQPMMVVNYSGRGASPALEEKAPLSVDRASELSLLLDEVLAADDRPYDLFLKIQNWGPALGLLARYNPRRYSRTSMQAFLEHCRSRLTELSAGAVA